MKTQTWLKTLCILAVFLLSSGLILNIQPLYAEDPTPTPTPTPTPEEEYEYSECGFVIDNSDEYPCFFGFGSKLINYDGRSKDDGPRTSYRIPSDGFFWAIWTPDYKNLNGPTEVFVTVPLYRPQNLDEQEPGAEPAPTPTPDTGTEPGEQEQWVEKVKYFIKTGEDAEPKDVEVEIKKYEGGLAPVGTFDFDGTEAYLGLFYPGGAAENEYVPVDSACFGSNCPVLADITPPQIEDVKTEVDGKGHFCIEAKVTDEGSGVASVGLLYNDNTFEMKTKGNDLYGTCVPYPPGTDMDYYIIAYDKSKNDAEWNPTRGYIRRGIGLGLGISLDSFWQVKTGHWKGEPAPADFKECSGFCGDPIDTRTGNLFEQMQLVNLPGRPEINFSISYNSQGGRVSIFGESWVHSYNSHVTEMDNPAFQGVFVQYPDGKTLTFSGPDFIPEPGVYDVLERDGEGFKLTKKDKTVLYFDSYGDLSRMEDANGNGLTFTYSEQIKFVNISKLASIKADGGREITFEYNDTGLVSQINLPEGKTLTFEYNETDDLVKLVNGEGDAIVYEYENHSIVKKISPQGHPYYTNTYDDQRRVTKQVAGTTWTHEMEYGENQTVVTNKNGQKFTYFYNDEGLMAANEDESGNRTSFEYNEDKKVEAETNAEGGRYEYKYDENGNQVYQKDPMGYVVEREFDLTFNKPTYEKNQKGEETRWEYDEKGNLRKIVNAAGNSATFTYNQYGQLIESTDFNGNKTTFAYTPAGDLASVTDALGNVVAFEYDGLGRMVKRINPLGVEFSYQYDLNDNLLQITGPLGYQVRFEYDKNSRQIKAIDPKGNVMVFEYDQSENLTAQINALGFRTAFEYGLMNEQLKMIDPEGRVTQYGYTPRYSVAEIIAAAGTPAEAVTKSEYNGLKLPVKMIDPEGRVTLFEYDALFRLVKVTQDANSAAVVTQYAYNPTGQIVQETDPNGHVTLYTLDNLDRIVSKEDAEGQITHFEYDAQGNLIKKTNPRGFATLYEYDGLNRLIKATDALSGVTEFTYDANGNLTSAKSPNKIVTHYEYDQLDRMVTKVENYVPAGPAAADANVTMRYEYDLNGNLVKLTNPRGYSTSFAYDAANRTVSITDAKGNSISYVYDKVDNLLQSTDRNGNVIAKAYDELNRLVQIINAENHKTLYAYDKVGNVTALTDPRNALTQFQYDGLNRRVAVIDALQGVERYEYDPAGNRLAKIDANGHANRYEYDRVNRLITSSNAEGHAAAISYDANGNPVQLTDRNGNVMRLSYDELDRLTLKLDALQGEWRYVYDPVGNLLTEIDANGHEDVYQYDALNRRVRLTDAEGNSTIIAYDPNSNRVQVIDGNGHAALFEYDELDRLASTTNAEGERTSFAYCAEGNRTDLIEADGIITRYEYDRIYRLVTVIQNFQDGQPEAADVNVDTRYTYDPNGNLLEILNPREYATRFEYDPLNRQIKEVDAEGNTWNFAYDPVGNRTLRVDANGQSTTYQYYPDNQVQQIGYENGTSVAFTYDPNNNRLSMVDRLGASAWTYDALNRVTAVNDALGRSLAYGYDAVGNRTGLTYPDGRRVNYGYYKNDWLQALTDPEGGLITYRRDGVGMTTQIINLNETFTGIQYDKVNRTLQIANQGKKLNSGFKYEYNAVGHRTKIQASYAWRTKDALTTTYQYDGLRRLIRSEDSDGVWNAYEYDRAGNRLQYATNDNGATNNPKDALSQSYSYNAINQVLAMVEDGKKPAATRFEYDANGNRVKKEFPGPQGPQVQGTRYSYDPENRLAEALNYQGNNKGNITERDVTTMDYDGLGRRLVKTHDNKEDGGGTKRVEYAFDGLDPAADYNTWNPQYTNYYRGDGNRIALRQNFPTGTEGQRYWYHYDALQSVVGLTKQNGQSDHNYPYADYGLIEPQTGNFTAPHNTYTYTGQMWDANIGVYEFYARAYDSEVGVWLQQDIYRGNLPDPMSLHRYGYVTNNPITYIDILGFTGGSLEQHTTVQNQFVATHPGTTPNYPIPNGSFNNPSNLGWADLVYIDPQSGKTYIWEVKPYSQDSLFDPYYATVKGPKQLQNYINNYQGPGTPTQGYPIQPDVFYQGDRQYVVWSDNRWPGMIFYDTNKGQCKKPEPIKVPVPIPVPIPENKKVSKENYGPAWEPNWQPEWRPASPSINSDTVKDAAKKSGWVIVGGVVVYVVWNSKGCLAGPVGCVIDWATPGL